MNDLRYLTGVLRDVPFERFRGTDVVVAYIPSIFTLYAAAAVRIRTRAKIVAVVHDIESGLAAALNISRGRTILLARARLIIYPPLVRATAIV